MSGKKQEHLSLPPDVEEEGGIEVLSAWVVNGAVSVALRRSFDEPVTWGVLLADLAHQAARAYALEMDQSVEAALTEIKQGFSMTLEDISNREVFPSMN